MATERLYKRAYKLSIFQQGSSDALVISTLAINFKVTKSGRNSLNGTDKAQIELINPSDNTLNTLRQPNTYIELQLGYTYSNVKQVFLGKIEADGITITDNGIDRIVKIKASPTGNSLREAFISSTVSSGMTLANAISTLKAAAVKKDAELASSIKSVEFQSGLADTILSDGFTFTGSFKKSLEKLTTMYGADYFIDGETLYIKKVNEAISSKNSQSLVLTPSTGLLDRPFLQSKDTSMLSSTTSNVQRVQFKTLINADLTCGDPVKIESSEVSGWFVVENILYSGQLRGDSWTTTCIAATFS